MLALLRRFAALTLASGLSVLTGWVPSTLNPADKASRKYAKRCRVEAYVLVHSHTSFGGRQAVRGVYSGFQSLGLQLRSTALASVSGRTYQRAVRRWLDFCREAPPHPHRTLHRRSGVRMLDECVCAYLASVYYYGEGRRRQLAVNTVYGLYYLHPSIRDQLADSEQLLNGWTRLRPSLSHPPLTWPLVTLIAVTMATNSYGDGALATLVAFDALLRISEFASLRVRDVADSVGPQAMVVSHHWWVIGPHS